MEERIVILEEDFDMVELQADLDRDYLEYDWDSDGRLMCHSDDLDNIECVLLDNSISYHVI